MCIGLIGIITGYCYDSAIMKRLPPFSHTDRGFSLIELLVAVAIFTIVMTVAAGALITMLGVNLKNRTVTVATNNLNVAVESLSRSIQEARSAYTIGAGGTSISFDISEGGAPVTVTYSIAPSPSGSGNAIYRSIGGASAQPITADDINITRLYFRASEYGSGTGQNILVTIAGEVGDPGNPAESTELVVQTTVSQQLQFVPGGAGSFGAAPGGDPYGKNIYCPFEVGPGIFVINLENNKNVDGYNWLGSSQSSDTLPRRTWWRAPRSSTGINTPVGAIPMFPNKFYDLSVPGRGGVVPPGTYDVYVATFEDHCDSSIPPPNCLNGIDGGHIQKNEQTYIEVYGASGNRLYDPVNDIGTGEMITRDIPDDINYIDPTLVATNVTLAATATHAAAFHAYYEGSPIIAKTGVTADVVGKPHSVVVACAAFVGPGTMPTGPVSIPVEIEQF